MSERHDPEQAIGRVTHYFGHLSVAAVTMPEPLALGERIHIRGQTSNVEQTVDSMEVEHKVVDHVREHDLVYRDQEPASISR